MYIHKYGDEFEWDAVKARSNYEKHGITFKEAVSVFSDIYGQDLPDLVHSQFEERRWRMGSSIFENILMISYTLRRDHHGETKIRIISARKASRKERAYYGR